MMQVQSGSEPFTSEINNVNDDSDCTEDDALADQEEELLALLKNAALPDSISIPSKAVSAADKSNTSSEWKMVRMRVTAYCTCKKCCGKNDGITANMHKVQPGDKFVAADKKFSFGTEMIIPGYNRNNPVEVKDRGRLIKGNRLDVFFPNHSVAKKWGTRYLDVRVKDEK